MKLTANDRRALRNPLLVLGAAVLLSMAMVFFSRQAQMRSTNLFERQQAALREAQERFRKSGDEKAKILRYREDFLALQRQGFVGEERRIDWVEALRAAGLGLGMSGVSYQIEARRALPAQSEAGRYRLRQSVMKVGMGLLHEEDLMRFIRALERQQAGLFSLRACSLARRASAEADKQPNLQAECSLAWLSIGEEMAQLRP